MKYDFNPKELILEKIKEKGGWVNAHSHIDRNYTLSEEIFQKGMDIPHTVKWDLNDQFKRDATVEEIYDRMARSLENLCSQGVVAVASFIDVDPVVKDKAMKAAQKARESFKNQIVIKYTNQVIKGLIDPEARKWFDTAAEFVDIVGGIPEKDGDRKEENFDILFTTAKKLGKPLHIHVDQLNDPDQRETEILVRKTKEYEYKGRVTGIHAVSIAAQPKEYRDNLYKELKEQEIRIVCCPSAWVDHRRNEKLVPSHNSITPVDEMIQAGVIVAMGTDNISDLHMPFNDGDMWFELRTLLQTARLFDVDSLVDIATVNGRKALWID